jgi:predicted nuclease with TOPRIM domain
MTRTLATLLNLSVDLSDLRTTSDEWEKKLDETVAEREELAEQVHKLEEEYDSEHFDTQMGDLKDWLEQKGVRLD